MRLNILNICNTVICTDLPYDINKGIELREALEEIEDEEEASETFDCCVINPNFDFSSIIFCSWMLFISSFLFSFFFSLLNIVLLISDNKATPKSASLKAPTSLVPSPTIITLSLSLSLNLL